LEATGSTGIQEHDSVIEVELDSEAKSGLGKDLKLREYQIIIDTLKQENGKKKNAAEKLGISPRTLRYKLAQMRDNGIDVRARVLA
jgi:two-component system response regulator FlrC